MARTKKILTVPALHIIAQAVEPLRIAAVTQATEHATAFMAGLKSKIDAQPDIEILAPYPKNYLDRYRATTAEYLAYTQACEFHNLVREFTTELEDTEPRDWSKPSVTMVAWCEASAAQYMAESIAKAEHNFVVYALKLIGKVEKDGNVATAASLSGDNDLWAESTLTVTLASGVTQRWYTKMIWNRSVLGNMFNQFPTRLLK